jgi:hypothetical protein
MGITPVSDERCDPKIRCVQTSGSGHAASFAYNIAAGDDASSRALPVL